MKKIISLSLIAFIAITLIACTKNTNNTGGRTTAGTQVASCTTPDGQNPCFNTEKNQYEIENGATLKFSTDNDVYGQAIVDLWNATHPNFAGKVSFVNEGVQGAADKITTNAGEFPDVVMVIDGEVPRNKQSLLPYHDYLKNLGSANGFKPANDLINSTSYVYLPSAYDGMAFSWNKTMLTALGVDLTDANNDGLPEAFDTFEEIFAIADNWATNRPIYKNKKVNVVFPMAIMNEWSVYSSLTAGGWKIFPDNDPTKPGFEQPAFLEGLKFIKEAGQHKLSVEEDGSKTPGASMGWRWDNYLAEEFSPFALVGTWMDVKGNETTRNADYKFSIMPSYKGTTLSPFVKTKGWVINAYTKYPSAAHELARLIYSAAGMQRMVDNSAYIPALVEGSTIMPTIEDTNKLEMSAAFAKNTVEPNFVLPNNKAKAAMDVYYGITIQNIFAEVYDGTKTPEAAQTEIVNLAKTWLEQNNVAQ